MVRSFVVDDGEITDFASFYTIKSSVLKFEPDNAEELEKMENDQNYCEFNKFGKVVKHGYNKVVAAFCYYTVVKDGNFDRHCKLMQSLMSQAAVKGHDVFNMVDVLNHKRLTENPDLLLNAGNGRLAHYLYNWRCPSMEPEDVGIILV